MTMSLVVLVVLLSGPALAPQPDTFDLICSGTMTMGPSRKGHKASTFAAHWRFHVDLVRNRYCLDECKTIEPIAQIDENSITFKDHKDYAGFSNYQAVNRRTGEYNARDYFPIEPPEEFLHKGTCSPADFTPFPAPQF